MKKSLNRGILSIRLCSFLLIYFTIAALLSVMMWHTVYSFFPIAISAVLLFFIVSKIIMVYTGKFVITDCIIKNRTLYADGDGVEYSADIFFLRHGIRGEVQTVSIPRSVYKIMQNNDKCYVLVKNGKLVNNSIYLKKHYTIAKTLLPIYDAVDDVLLEKEHSEHLKEQKEAIKQLLLKERT